MTSDYITDLEIVQQKMCSLLQLSSDGHDHLQRAINAIEDEIAEARTHLADTSDD